MSDAYGQSPHDYPDDYLDERRVIPDRVRCRHELREWLQATLEAREIAAMAEADEALE